MTTVYGAPSFRLASDCVELFVTQTAGMLAPVTFRFGERTFSPYALAPWKPEDLDPALPSLLRCLRGDFLCLPFGPQDHGEPHGDTANADWSLAAESESSLHLTINPGDVCGTVDKLLTLRPGHPALYCEHRISGVEGDFSYGNHPVLDISHLPPGAARVTASPFRWASVNPGLFSNPENREYQALQPGAEFTDLAAVPLAAGGTTDLTRYPARRGHDDLVLLASEPASEAQPFAWTACVMDRFLWFSLKDPGAFPATLFWISNGGRHGEPWNGRHLARLGLEEVCSHFADNVTVSRQDKLAKHGIPTTRRFSRDETISLRIVQAAAELPANFGAVATIRPAADDRLAITSDTGATIETTGDWQFLSPFSRS